MEMKRTSVPEQAILFYIRKYVDRFAENNNVCVGRYTADIALMFRGQKYVIEYDSGSQHADKMQKEMVRDKLFLEQGYKVIRMRDRGLDFVPGVVNFCFDFQDYKQKSIAKANEGINELLSFFGMKEKVDIASDLETIKEMYREYPD